MWRNRPDTLFPIVSEADSYGDMIVTHKASLWDLEASVSRCTPQQPRRHRSRCSVSSGPRVQARAPPQPPGLVLGVQVSGLEGPRASTARWCRRPVGRGPSARHRRQTSTSSGLIPRPNPWCLASTSDACSGTSRTPRSRPGRHGLALMNCGHGRGLTDNRRPGSALCRCCTALTHCTFLFYVNC